MDLTISQTLMRRFTDQDKPHKEIKPLGLSPHPFLFSEFCRAFLKNNYRFLNCNYLAYAFNSFPAFALFP